jgi:hypothetical protein
MGKHRISEDNSASPVEQIVTAIADRLMEDHGWLPHMKEQYADRWDTKNPKSIYSTLLRTAQMSVDYVFEMIMSTDTGEQEEEPHMTSEKEQRSPVINKTSANFIFLQAQPGDPIYISDVAEWLDSARLAGFPDDTEVEGFLHTSYDMNPETIERINCLDCGDQGDRILLNHTCKPKHQDTPLFD